MSRDYDIHLLGTVDSANRLALSMPLDALSCYGPAAAVQQFIAVMFTRKGSDSVNPEYGTDFMQSVISGQYSSEHEISMLFLNCASDAISQLAGYNGNVIDEDERVIRASVQSVQITNGTVDIVANLELQSGDSAVAVMPIRWAAA